MDWIWTELLEEEDRDEWEPLPLYIELDYPLDYPEEEKEDEHSSVIIIDI